MAHVYSSPRYVFYGNGALEDAAQTLAGFGRKALIVSGMSMIRQGHMKALTDLLESLGTAYVVFSGISGEPTDTMILEGARIYREKGCDFLIGFGGGSPLDSAKAIAVMADYEGRISDFNGKVIERDLPPVAAIPSTAGTGSEVTQFTIITDTANDIKMLLKGKCLVPTVAIIDPRFSMASPKSVTAASGLDALTHAVESYTSRKATPFTDMYAMDAVKRIFKALPAAYADGDNTEARFSMAIAAYEAGLCINNASVTIVHGMSRPIGALFHVPHGLSNAMLLTTCLSFALDGALDRFAALGRAIGVANERTSDEDAGRAFIEAMGELCRTCEVPTLEAYGVDREAFMAACGKMAQDAKDSGSPANTMKEVSVEDMIRLYQQLWD